MSFMPRISQRKPLSCSECTRRKLRCSKTIPCTSCRDRGLEATCQREAVIVRKRNQRQSSNASSSTRGSTGPAIPPQSPDRPGIGSITVESLCDTASPGDVKSQHPSATVPDDAPVTLENLALGRQRILNMPSPGAGSSPSILDSSSWLPADVDLLVSLEQAMMLVGYHAKSLAFIHNVLHMPTFAEEVETAFTQRVVKSRAWLALFYAFLCHTCYHGSQTIAVASGLLPQKAMVEQLYSRTIQALHAADYMAVHSLHAVQASCLMIQVAHNLGLSDFVFVLLSSTTRIAQFLDLNRIGPDTQPCADPVHREVKKRVWWFLIKQDWMQIPYGNMFTINALHFNTPPPLNCYEERSLMTDGSVINVQPVDVLTQGSWAGIHNFIAILIYKTHDRMCRLGHPGNDPDRIRALYEEVLAANAELQSIWNRRPAFLKPEVPISQEWPSSVVHLRRLFTISFARVYFTIHRHFQLKSFRDDAYSVTRLCCLSAARSSLRAFIEWPDDEESLIYKKMWTNNNNLVAAAVAILFGLLFSKDESEGPFEKLEMRQLLLDFLPCLRSVAQYSSVARRGADLIGVILDYERAINEGSRDKLDIAEVIGHMKTRGLMSVVPSYSDWTTSLTDQGDFMTAESWESLPQVPFL